MLHNKAETAVHRNRGRAVVASVLPLKERFHAAAFIPLGIAPESAQVHHCRKGRDIHGTLSARPGAFRFRDDILDLCLCAPLLVPEHEFHLIIYLRAELREFKCAADIGLHGTVSIVPAARSDLSASPRDIRLVGFRHHCRQHRIRRYMQHAVLVSIHGNIDHHLDVLAAHIAPEDRVIRLGQILCLFRRQLQGQFSVLLLHFLKVPVDPGL